MSNLSDLEVINTCPLGSVCEEIKDNKIHRCKLYIMIRGTDATGEEHNEWNCSFSWAPLLQLENAKVTREVGAGVESMRNENTKRQDIALQSISLLSSANNTLNTVKEITIDED